MTRLTLYGKAGCHLCEEAEDALAEVRGDVPFELDIVDIALDPVLFRRYGERIPVLDVDGDEALELGFDAEAVRDVLSRVGP